MVAEPNLLSPLHRCKRYALHFASIEDALSQRTAHPSPSDQFGIILLEGVYDSSPPSSCGPSQRQPQPCAGRLSVLHRRNAAWPAIRMLMSNLTMLMSPSSIGQGHVSRSKGGGVLRTSWAGQVPTTRILLYALARDMIK